MNDNEVYARELMLDESIVSLLEFSTDIQQEAKGLVEKEFLVENAIATSLISSSAYFAMALHANREEKRWFPHQWIESENINTDIVFSCILCQLANYSYSVLSLINKGLDTPARALLRSTSDLSYMLSVLSNDRDTLQEYVLNDKLLPKELWYKLFSNKKIAVKFKKIENMLGFSEKMTRDLRLFREDRSNFFSEAVHHSPTAIMVGAMPRKIGSDIVELAVLGGSPRASGSTLIHLIISLNHGLHMFINSKRKASEFSYPEPWESGIDIFEKVQPLFLKWVKENQQG